MGNQKHYLQQRNTHLQRYGSMYDLSDDEKEFQLQTDSGSVRDLQNEAQVHFLTEADAPRSPLSEGISQSTSDIQLKTNGFETNTTATFADKSRVGNLLR
jgi:hypothetical protein